MIQSFVKCSRAIVNLFRASKYYSELCKPFRDVCIYSEHCIVANLHLALSLEILLLHQGIQSTSDSVISHGNYFDLLECDFDEAGNTIA